MSNLEKGLTDVRQIIRTCFRSTSLAPMADELETTLVGGKMIRARLGLQIAFETGIPYQVLVHSMAAVEMIHAASLLHDDVIDGAYLRRNAPTFWVDKGTSGAILLGDLLVSQSMMLINKTGKGFLLSELLRVTREMCDAEAEQELLYCGKKVDWEKCVSIAKRKTGSLFAFVGYVCGGSDIKLRTALQEASYAIGTAYQLSDDLFDASGSPESASKTLGSDAVLAKITAASAYRSCHMDPMQYINDLCKSSQETLSSWPAVSQAWNDFMTNCIYPVINEFTESFVMDEVC